jgi:hypothetical protein
MFSALNAAGLPQVSTEGEFQELDIDQRGISANPQNKTSPGGHCFNSSRPDHFLLRLSVQPLERLMSSWKHAKVKIPTLLRVAQSLGLIFSVAGHLVCKRPRLDLATLFIEKKAWRLLQPSARRSNLAKYKVSRRYGMNESERESAAVQSIWPATRFSTIRKDLTQTSSGNEYRG